MRERVEGSGWGVGGEGVFLFILDGHYNSRLVWRGRSGGWVGGWVGGWRGGGVSLRIRVEMLLRRKPNYMGEGSGFGGREEEEWGGWDGGVKLYKKLRIYKYFFLRWKVRVCVCVEGDDAVCVVLCPRQKGRRRKTKSRVNALFRFCFSRQRRAGYQPKSLFFTYRVRKKKKARNKKKENKTNKELYMLRERITAHAF